MPGGNTPTVGRGDAIDASGPTRRLVGNVSAMVHAYHDGASALGASVAAVGFLATSPWTIAAGVALQVLAAVSLVARLLTSNDGRPMTRLDRVSVGYVVLAPVVMALMYACSAYIIDHMR